MYDFVFVVTAIVIIIWQPSAADYVLDLCVCVCLCLCVNKFCVQDISQINFWIFSKFIADTSYILLLIQ